MLLFLFRLLPNNLHYIAIPFKEQLFEMTSSVIPNSIIGLAENGVLSVHRPQQLLRQRALISLKLINLLNPTTLFNPRQCIKITKRGNLFSPLQGV